MTEENRNFNEAQNPKARLKKKSRRTRFGEDKRNVIQPRPVPIIHPDDLPQRARWTIIITAGLLLITCMLLVGVTLRMAPVIDELGKLLKLHFNVLIMHVILLLQQYTYIMSMKSNYIFITKNIPKENGAIQNR